MNRAIDRDSQLVNSRQVDNNRKLVELNYAQGLFHSLWSQEPQSLRCYKADPL